MLAFISPQEGILYKKCGGYDHTPYLTSVDIVEVLTRIDFSAGLQVDIEEAIESVIKIRLWD